MGILRGIAGFLVCAITAVTVNLGMTLGIDAVGNSIFQRTDVGAAAGGFDAMGLVTQFAWLGHAIPYLIAIFGIVWLFVSLFQQEPTGQYR
jgi:hypothetical protein